MERPAYSLKAIAGISVLVILHAVGLAGFAQSSWKGIFQTLVPVHLLISALMLLLFHQQWSWRFVLTGAGISAGGWLVEYIGVQSNLLFGAYQYTSVLGVSVYGVPLMMAVNWLMLVYGVGGIVQHLSIPLIGRILIGGMLMLLVDVGLEQFAITHELWVWDNDTVPLKNYLAWFFISCLFLWQLLVSSTVSDNPLALPLILLQVLFFYGGWLAGIW
jgi:putative membrane protein